MKTKINLKCLAIGFLIAAFVLMAGSELFAQNKKIVVMNQYWAKDGKVQEVYQLRLHASEIRKELGLPVGRVLLKTTAAGESPTVIWECEYPSNEAREKDVQKLRESGKFDEVMKEMRTLADKFERTVYETSAEESTKGTTNK